MKSLRIDKATVIFLIISGIALFFIIMTTGEKNKESSVTNKDWFDAVSGATISVAKTKTSPKIQGVFKEVLDKTEFVAIVTWDENYPHIVGTWGDYVKIKSGGKILLIPSGGHHATEKDLRTNKNIQLLIASKEIKKGSGSGQGCVIYGKGEIQTYGQYAREIRNRFSWARAALVIEVERVETRL